MFKKAVLILSFVLSCSVFAADEVSPSSMAGAWPVEAYVTWTPGLVTSQVYTYWGVPVNCQGRLQTVMVSSWYAWFNFAMGPIYPGMYGYAYISTNPYDPIVNAWAETWCWPAY